MNQGGKLTFSVLMVCTGNICRSPMAEGLLSHLLPDSLKARVTVSSAGTHGLYGNQADPFAIKAAAAHGADISMHRARILYAGLVKSSDLVLGMERFHLEAINRMFLFRCKYARLLGTFAPQGENTEIEDPYRSPFEAYEAAAEAILACMPGLIDYIRNQLDGKAS
jgi:protein-tyrosine phosphatase